MNQESDRSVIQSDCKPFLALVNDSGGYLYRGLGEENSDFLTRDVRRARLPKNMPLVLHAAADAWFSQTFGVRYRSAAEFCTGDRGQAAEYGNVYRIFPIGGFQFCWSPKVRDLYEWANAQGRLDLPPEEFVAELASLNYRDDGLEEAIDSGCEIMVSCRRYHAASLNEISGTTAAEEALRIRERWESTKSDRLRLKLPPPSEINEAGFPVSAESRAVNVQERMRHLSAILSLMHKIYWQEKDLYGDHFLAFIGDKIVRQWPWIDLPAVSEKAAQWANDVGIHKPMLGLSVRELSKDIKLKESKIRYEHITPMAFFRDVVRNHPPLSADIYFDLLKRNYRVAWITKSEDDNLNAAGARFWRSINTYEDVGIALKKPEEWTFFDD